MDPDDIKSYDDLKKIPLLQDKFFKDYPGGKEFAVWLSNIFTGDIPTVRIRRHHPTYDDVIRAFNSAGLAISHSRGTSGKHTFIPRDKRTFDIAEYAFAKPIVTMVYPLWEYNISAYLLMPNPFKTNLFAGKVCSVLYDAVKEVTPAIDREITTETIRLVMSRRGIRSSFIRFASAMAGRRLIRNIARWLEEKEKIAFVGAPYIAYEVIEYLIREVNEVLGINEEHCLDVYAMVEGNGIMVHCPERHYLYILVTYVCTQWLSIKI